MTLFKEETLKQDEKGFNTSLGPGTGERNTLIKHCRRHQPQPKLESLGKQVKRKNEIITKFDVETSGNCKFADTWKRLFPTAIEAGTMTAAGWSQELLGEELENVTLERLFRRGAGINSAKHPKTECF